MDIATLIGIIEKLAKIGAIIIGGGWIYFKTIRGRAFIPRLQPQVAASLILNNDHHYLFIKSQVENVGSSIARIKEKGTALKIESLQAFGDIDSVMDLTVEDETAFQIFSIAKGQSIAIEPGTTIYYEELIEVPKDKYDAFRIELRVSAIRGGLSRRDRKWRAFAIVFKNNKDNAVKQPEG